MYFPRLLTKYIGFRLICWEQHQPYVQKEFPALNVWLSKDVPLDNPPVLLGMLDAKGN